MSLFFDKIQLSFLRFTYFIVSYPKRLLRLWKHLTVHLKYLHPKEKSFWWACPVPMGYGKKVAFWCLEFFLYILDLLGVAECYGTIVDWLKFKSSRRLKEWEINIARTVFRDTLQYRIITFDEKAILGIKVLPQATAYVSFHTVNYYGSMTNDLMIHELIHVWQYENFGSAYTLRALLAQQSTMGYNYGGANVLKSAIANRLDFLSFNFEQQGDLVQDYYRIQNGYTPLWGKGDKRDLLYYEHFVQQLGGVFA